MSGINDIRVINLAFSFISPTLSLLRIHTRTHRHSQKFIYRPHLLSITVCQIFIRRNQHGAFSSQRIQIKRHGGCQRLTLACIHLCQITIMQRDPSKDLTVIGLLSQNSPIRLTYYRKCPGKNAVC